MWRTGHVNGTLRSVASTCEVLRLLCTPSFSGLYTLPALAADISKPPPVPSVPLAATPACCLQVMGEVAGKLECSSPSRLQPYKSVSSCCLLTSSYLRSRLFPCVLHPVSFPPQCGPSASHPGPLGNVFLVAPDRARISSVFAANFSLSPAPLKLSPHSQTLGRNQLSPLSLPLCPSTCSLISVPTVPLHRSCQGHKSSCRFFCKGPDSIYILGFEGPTLSLVTYSLF